MINNRHPAKNPSNHQKFNFSLYIRTLAQFTVTLTLGIIGLLQQMTLGCIIFSILGGVFCIFSVIGLVWTAHCLINDYFIWKFSQFVFFTAEEGEGVGERAGEGEEGKEKQEET